MAQDYNCNGPTDFDVSWFITGVSGNDFLKVRYLISRVNRNRFFFQVRTNKLTDKTDRQIDVRPSVGDGVKMVFRQETRTPGCSRRVTWLHGPDVTRIGSHPESRGMPLSKVGQCAPQKPHWVFSSCGRSAAEPVGPETSTFAVYERTRFHITTERSVPTRQCARCCGDLLLLLLQVIF